MKRQAGLAALALLHLYWLLQPVSIALKGVAVLLVILGVLRPASAAIAFAAIAPLSTVVAGWCGSAGAGAQLLEQMVLAITAGTILRLKPGDARTRLGTPAFLMGLVAIASALSLIPARAAGADWPLGDLGLRQAAQSSPIWSPLFVALTIAHCALLGWAVERCIRQTPALAGRLVFAGLAGHAASAAMSVEAVLTAAFRTGQGLAALPQLLMSVRLSLQTDWNAAGSLFLLAGIAGTGLVAARGVRGMAAGLLVTVVTAGLWITGSRAAIVLAVLAAVASLGWFLARHSRHRRILVVGAVGLTLAVGAWLVSRYPEGRNDKPGDTLRGRLQLMQAGVRMFEASPVFGIGIDGFYTASARFISADPTLPNLPERENAHNNFVQVLAEQGLAGLAVMLWWLGVMFVSAVRAQLRQPTPVRGALLVAMAACVATWMTGHPLLVPEFAFVFWLYGGVLTGLTPTPAQGMRWPAWIVILALAISIPIRASANRTAADLEYRGRKVSIWHHDDTQRYRNAGRTFALFLRASGRPIDIPIRRAPGVTTPLLVTIRMGDRVLNRVTVQDDAWQGVVVVVPPGRRLYELVDFLVDSAASQPDVLLRVGREAQR